MNDVTQLQHLFDLQTDEWLAGYRKRGGQIFCRRGCHNCCSLVVNCSFPEAAWVAQHLPEAYVLRLEEYAQKMIRLAEEAHDLKSYLRDVRNQAGGCPFLAEDGACGVYVWRPLSCRSLLSTAHSRYCAADFASMEHDEKEAFVTSLDRDVVRYPTAYVDVTQHLAQQMEALLLKGMQQDKGVSLSGNMPYLVWLERKHDLSLRLSWGRGELLRYMAACGLERRYLTEVHHGDQRVSLTPRQES